MLAESDALSYWPVAIVPGSKLPHMATTHYGFVPKLSHHGGKTPRFALKNLFGRNSAYVFYCFAQKMGNYPLYMKRNPLYMEHTL